jgi:ABC-type uncharacterized transport system substrate-binding protein
VSLKVDVILASGTPPVPAAKSATKTIPIVFVASIDLLRPGWPPASHGRAEMSQE